MSGPPPDWKIPDFYFFIHPNGGSGAFAIEGAEGYDYFQLDRAGVKGPAYFVGSELYGIYTALGKEGLFAAMRDPRRTFQLYRDALKAKPALLRGCPEIPEAVAQHALSIGASRKEP